MLTLAGVFWAAEASSGGLDTITVITALVALAVGSGGGGLIGAFIAFKRFSLEQTESETKQAVDLQSVDVEQFKALFPGGLGDAVEHWRDEARSLYTEVDQLREQRGTDHEEIINLRSDLRITNRKLEYTKGQLDKTRVELAQANERIAQLELERNHDSG